MSKNEEELDKEALEMLRDHRIEDMTYEEIAEKYDVSESTIARRLKKARSMEKDFVEEVEEAEEEAKEEGKKEKDTEKAMMRPSPEDGGQLATFENVVNIIETLETDEEVSEDVGLLTGLNTETIFSGITKAAEGEATKREIGALAKNIAGVYFGFKRGHDVREKKEEMTQGEDDGGKKAKRAEFVSKLKEALQDEELREEILGNGE